MPLPTPSAKETKEEFMSRCMEAVTKSGEFESQEQCAAVCINKWEDRNEKDDEDDD